MQKNTQQAPEYLPSIKAVCRNGLTLISFVWVTNRSPLRAAELNNTDGDHRHWTEQKYLFILNFFKYCVWIEKKNALFFVFIFFQFILFQ